MKHFAQTLNLKDDLELIARYKEYHRQIWPEVVSGLKAIGITRMKIFLMGRQMFMYYEAVDDFDPATDFEKYLQMPGAKEWEELMHQFQEPQPGSPPNGLVVANGGGVRLGEGLTYLAPSGKEGNS